MRTSPVTAFELSVIKNIKNMLRLLEHRFGIAEVLPCARSRCRVVGGTARYHWCWSRPLADRCDIWLSHGWICDFLQYLFYSIMQELEVGPADPPVYAPMLIREIPTLGKVMNVIQVLIG